MNYMPSYRSLTSHQKTDDKSCELAGKTGENLRRGKRFCVIDKSIRKKMAGFSCYLKDSVHSSLTLFNESASVHRDYGGP